MYNVNTDKINQILSFFEGTLFPLFKEMLEINEELAQRGGYLFALQRAFHLYIEGMTDIGNLLIDGFIMRDPGSYEDIVDIMEDEKVYIPEQAAIFKEIISLRKPLVTDYTVNISETLLRVLSDYYPIMTQYPVIIRDYLKKELW